MTNKAIHEAALALEKKRSELFCLAELEKNKIDEEVSKAGNYISEELSKLAEICDHEYKNDAYGKRCVVCHHYVYGKYVPYASYRMVKVEEGE